MSKKQFTAKAEQIKQFLENEAEQLGRENRFVLAKAGLWC